MKDTAENPEYIYREYIWFKMYSNKLLYLFSFIDFTNNE